MKSTEYKEVAIGDLVRAKLDQEHRYYIVTDKTTPTYYLTITCCIRGIEFHSPARDYEVIKCK
jgi:hypothetical protein